MLSDIRVQIDVEDIETVESLDNDKTRLVSIRGEGETIMPVVYHLSDWLDDNMPASSSLVGSRPDCFPDIPSSKEWHSCTCGHHVCFFEERCEGNITGFTEEALSLPIGVIAKI